MTPFTRIANSKPKPLYTADYIPKCYAFVKYRISKSKINFWTSENINIFSNCINDGYISFMQLEQMQMQTQCEYKYTSIIISHVKLIWSVNWLFLYYLLYILNRYN